MRSVPTPHSSSWSTTSSTRLEPISPSVPQNRRVRRVHNRIVNISDVAIEAGPDFVNWILISREKLAQRESILLRKRIAVVESIISDFIASLATHDRFRSLSLAPYLHHCRSFFGEYSPTGTIIRDCDREIIRNLQEWRGLRRSKKTTHTFKEYFKISKNGWDQRKIELTASHFWVPLIELLSEMNQTVAFSLLDIPYPELCHAFLNCGLFHRIFIGTIKIANSRDRLLIPAGVYLYLHSSVEIRVKNIIHSHPTQSPILTPTLTTTTSQRVIRSGGGTNARASVLNLLCLCQNQIENSWSKSDLQTQQKSLPPTVLNTIVTSNNDVQFSRPTENRDDMNPKLLPPPPPPPW